MKCEHRCFRHETGAYSPPSQSTNIVVVTASEHLLQLNEDYTASLSIRNAQVKK